MREQKISVAEALIGKGFTPTHALAYHRTGSNHGTDINALNDHVQKVFKKFIPGSGDYYGRGLYACGDKKSQISVGGGRMSSYGLALIQYRISLKNILIFDYRLSEKVHPNAVTLEEQLIKMVPSLSAKNMPQIFQVLSEDLTKTLQSANKLISADRCKYVWNDCIRNGSGKMPSLYGLDKDTASAYYAAFMDPSFATATSIAKSSNIHGVAFVGEHDGDVIVVYDKFVDADTKAIKWCVTDPRYPNDESHLLVDWTNAGQGISSAETDLADGLAKARIPNSKSSFDAVFIEKSADMGIAGSIDFIRTNHRWLTSSILQFKSVDIAFLQDKSCYITGGQWIRGDCFADYFGREDKVTAELKRAGKELFSNSSNKDMPIFHSGTFNGACFTGVFTGGVFKKGVFDGLLKGGLLDFDSGVKWGDSAIIDTSERTLQVRIKYKGKTYLVPSNISNMNVFIKSIEAGLTSTNTQLADASLTDAIQRYLPFQVIDFEIADNWRGNRTITEAFIAFKIAYPWLLNKFLRQHWKEAPSIKVTNDEIIVKSGVFYTGTAYYSRYEKGVTINGGIIDGNNIFEGKFNMGVYKKGTFNGIFSGGVYNLDSAIWGDDALGKTEAVSNSKVIYKGKYIDIIAETYFIPDVSGKNPLYKNFKDVLLAIQKGSYQKITSELVKEIELAKRHKGPPPKLIKKATQYLKKLNITQVDDLGDDFSDEDISDDEVSKLLVASKEPSRDKMSFKELFDEAYSSSKMNVRQSGLSEKIKFIDDEGVLCEEDSENALLNESNLSDKFNVARVEEDKIRQIFCNKEFNEKEFYVSDLTDPEQDALYQEFVNSYTKATGAAFDRDSFMYKTDNWTFLGDPPNENNPPSTVGGIAIRKQPSGLIKLVASFGHIKSIIRGFSELKQKYGQASIWGFVTEPIKRLVIKHDKDFISLPGPVVKAMEGLIKKLSYGGEVKSVGLDGSIMVDTPAGVMKKYLVANKNYARFLVDAVEDPANASKIPISQAVLHPLIGLVKALI